MRILPCSDVCGRDGIYRLILKVWQYAVLEYVLFAVYAVLPKSVAHILYIEVIERLEGHVRGALQPLQKGTLPLLGFSLKLKATLLFLLFGSRIVCIVELAVPCLA